MLVPLVVRTSPARSLRMPLRQAGWRPDLVLQMPRELYQRATLAELPISLRQPRELLPPARSPILNDCDAYAGLKHHFLAGYSVAGHLISSGRLAFGPTPVFDVHAMRRMRIPTSCQELQACLQRTLVTAPSPGTSAAAAMSA